MNPKLLTQIGVPIKSKRIKAAQYSLITEKLLEGLDEARTQTEEKEQVQADIEDIGCYDTARCTSSFRSEG